MPIHKDKIGNIEQTDIAKEGMKEESYFMAQNN